MARESSSSSKVYRRPNVPLTRSLEAALVASPVSFGAVRPAYKQSSVVVPTTSIVPAVPVPFCNQLPPLPPHPTCSSVTQGSSTASLWMRNIQLGSFSLFLGLLAVVFKDGAAVANRGYFSGYSPMVWLCISLHSLGGLAVAMVVKYADNVVRFQPYSHRSPNACSLERRDKLFPDEVVLSQTPRRLSFPTVPSLNVLRSSLQVKCFATSISIVLSCVLSIAFLGMQLSQGFAVGALMVRTRNRAPAEFVYTLSSLVHTARAAPLVTSSS